jgi:hypothetical protein
MGTQSGVQELAGRDIPILAHPMPNSRRSDLDKGTGTGIFDVRKTFYMIKVTTKAIISQTYQGRSSRADSPRLTREGNDPVRGVCPPSGVPYGRIRGWFDKALALLTRLNTFAGEDEVAGEARRVRGSA